jgi:hypothetical protein
MAESPRRVDLRLTIPAAAPFRTVASELAEKFAEHVGAPNPKSVVEQLAAAVSRATSAAPDGDILIEMSSENGGVAISAVSGAAATRPNQT